MSPVGVTAVVETIFGPVSPVPWGVDPGEGSVVWAVDGFVDSVP